MCREPLCFFLLITENNGIIENVVNAASASASSIAAGNKGLICGINTGVMSNCTNKGDIIAAADAVMEDALCVGGVAGASASKARMNSCVNEGSVSVSLPGSKTLVAAAGVVGNCESEIGSCDNKGAISLFCESAEGKADGCFKAVSAAGVAGIVSWENGNAASVYQTTSRQSVGGVISSPWGKVTKCTNKGEIDVDWITVAHNAALAKNFVGQVGGVVGGDYNSDQVSSSMEGCINEGNIDIVFDASQSNSAFGGVAGWGGKEAAAGVNVIRNCKNSGSLTLDGFSKTRLGGISGSPVKIEGCVNSGEVYLKGGLANCAAGGIAGFGNFHNISGCENYGNVKSDVKLAGAESSAAGGLGGLVGAVGNTAMTYSGCKVDCTVSAPAGSAASMLVGVIGHNKSGGKAFAVGTAESPNKIKGSFAGTTLTPENYQTYMRRPDFKLVNNSVTFNVEYLK